MYWPCSCVCGGGGRSLRCILKCLGAMCADQCYRHIFCSMLIRRRDGCRINAALHLHHGNFLNASAFCTAAHNSRNALASSANANLAPTVRYLHIRYPVSTSEQSFLILHNREDNNVRGNSNSTHNSTISRAIRPTNRSHPRQSPSTSRRAGYS